VRDHRTLREAGGARGVEQAGDVVARAGGRRGAGRSGEGRRKRDGPGNVAVDEHPGADAPRLGEVREPRVVRRGGDEDRRARVGQDVADLGRGEAVVHRHRDGARRDGAEVPDDELGRVRQEQAHPRARPGSLRDEGGEAAAAVGELPVGEGRAPVADRGLLPEVAVREDDVGDRAKGGHGLTRSSSHRRRRRSGPSRSPRRARRGRRSSPPAPPAAPSAPSASAR